MGDMETPPRRLPRLPVVRTVRAHPRLFASALAGAIVGFFLPDQWREMTRALVAWNAAVVLYLLLSIQLIARATHESIRWRAKIQDEGRIVILFLATATACASMGAIIAELGPIKHLTGWPKSAHLLLTVITVLDSWLFMHLTFAFHYAHEYYLERTSSPEKKPAKRGGLIFPGTAEPRYIDFLYFAYVIGVACQTADVSTSSRPMRAAALVQGILAFFYNTAILALMVNIASGLI